MDELVEVEGVLGSTRSVMTVCGGELSATFADESAIDAAFGIAFADDAVIEPSF